MIPKIIHRTIPAKTNPVIDFCWEEVQRLHPDWELMTHYDEDDYPLTKKYFDKCPSGAFRADLIRLEVVYRYGGIFLDSDVQIIKALDPLLEFDAFCGLEHPYYFGNVAFGAKKKHPAIKAMIDFAIKNLDILETNTTISDEYYSGVAWGPWVHTEVLKTRKDVKFLHQNYFTPFNLVDELSEGLKKVFPLWRPVPVDNPRIIDTLPEEMYGAHMFNWSWVEDKPWAKRA